MSLFVLALLARPGGGGGGAEASPPRVRSRGAALEPTCWRRHGATPGAERRARETCGEARGLPKTEHLDDEQLSCSEQRRRRLGEGAGAAARGAHTRTTEKNANNGEKRYQKDRDCARSTEIARRGPRSLEIARVCGALANLGLRSARWMGWEQEGAEVISAVDRSVEAHEPDFVGRTTPGPLSDGVQDTRSVAVPNCHSEKNSHALARNPMPMGENDESGTRWHEGCSEKRRETAKRDRKRQTPPRVGDG